jgi:hypothetical protein
LCNASAIDDAPRLLALTLLKLLWLTACIAAGDLLASIPFDLCYLADDEGSSNLQVWIRAAADQSSLYSK